MACTNLSYVVRLHRLEATCIDAMVELASAASPAALQLRLQDFQALLLRKCMREGRNFVRPILQELCDAVDLFPQTQVQWVLGFAVPSVISGQTPPTRQAGEHIDQLQQDVGRR